MGLSRKLARSSTSYDPIAIIPISEALQTAESTGYLDLIQSCEENFARIGLIHRLDNMYSENAHIPFHSPCIWDLFSMGLKGEAEKICTVEHNEKTEWCTLEIDASTSILMWYKTYFDYPGGTDPVVLDLESMGKGQAWVNGHHIGSYWNILSEKDGCKTCDYRGAYNSDKCTTNCGKPTQSRCSLSCQVIHWCSLKKPGEPHLRFR